MFAAWEILNTAWGGQQSEDGPTNLVDPEDDGATDTPMLALEDGDPESEIDDDDDDDDDDEGEVPTTQPEQTREDGYFDHDMDPPVPTRLEPVFDDAVGDSTMADYDLAMATQLEFESDIEDDIQPHQEPSAFEMQCDRQPDAHEMEHAMTIQPEEHEPKVVEANPVITAEVAEVPSSGRDGSMAPPPPPAPGHMQQKADAIMARMNELRLGIPNLAHPPSSTHC